MKRYKVAITYVVYADSDDEALDKIEEGKCEPWNYKIVDRGGDFEDDGIEDIFAMRETEDIDLNLKEGW